MPIDVDVQSFAEENANITDCNTKYVQLAPLVDNPSLNSSYNNKIPVRRSGAWSIEGEEAYNGYYQDFGNISGEVVLTMNGDSCRTAMLATVTGNTFITGFGANFVAGVVYTLFVKQDAVGGFSVRWPYGASILNQVGINPNQITEVYIVKLPNGKVFIKCEAFQNTAEIGYVIKEFEFPNITYPDSTLATMSFTWSKAPAVSYGGTLTGLYSDWEIADDVLYTNLLFSSYNNTTDLYAIQVVLTQAGTVYMRTRYGGNIGGTPIISDWDEAVVELSGIDGDKYWDQTVLCINANKYGWEGSRKIVDEKWNSPVSVIADTKIMDFSGKWIINFDGSGDYLVVGNTGLFNFLHNGSSWTFELFVNFSDVSSGNLIFDTARGATSTVGGIFIIFDTNGNLRVTIVRGVDGTYVINKTFTEFSFFTGVDYHIAFTFDYSLGSNNCKMFVNGELKDSGTKTANSPVTTNCYDAYFGAFSASYPSDMLAGKVYSIRITNNIIRYTSDFQVDLTNPYFKTGNLWWTPEPKYISNEKFLDYQNWDKTVCCINGYGVANSTAIADSAGNSITLSGDTKIAVTNNTSYINFDGTGDTLNFPFSLNYLVGNYDFCLEFFYRAGSTATGTILSDASSFGGYYSIRVDSDTSGTRINVFLYDSTTTLINISSSVLTAYGNIVHVALVRNGTNILLFINGASAGSSTITAGRALYTAPANLKLGLYGNSQYFTGGIYSFRISMFARYTTPFTAPDITRPYFITKPKVENWAETSLVVNAYNLPVNSTDIRDAKGNTISVYGDTKVGVDSNGLQYINSTNSTFDGFGFLSSSAVLSNKDFTIEWFLYKVANNPNSSALYSAGPDNGLIHIDLSVSISADGALTAYASTIGAVSWDLLAFTNGPVLANNTLYHVAIVRSGGNIDFFVNGIKSPISTSLSTTALNNNGAYRAIGQPSNVNRSLIGRIYGFRVTTGKALYSSNFNVDLTNPYFPALDSISDLWIDGNDYSKMTLATGVSKVVDKSGNSWEASQSTTTAQPALVQNAQNGLMSLDFDGVDDHLLNTQSRIQKNLSGDVDVFVVLKKDVGTSPYWGGGIFTDGTSAAELGIEFLYSDGIWYCYSDGLNVTSNSTISQTDFFKSQNFCVSNFTHVVGQRIKLNIDGSEINVLSGTGIALSNSSGFYIGRRSASQLHWPGFISDLLVMAYKVSEHWKNIIRGFLAHKWGLTSNLPANHPYKTGFPVEDLRTDDYWYFTVLCINGTDIIRPAEIVDSARMQKLSAYGTLTVPLDSSNRPYIYFNGGWNALYFPFKQGGFGSGDFTVEMFVQFSGWNPNSARLWNANGDVYHEFDMSAGPSGLLGLYASSNGSSWNIISNAGICQLSLNTLYHIAVVRYNNYLWVFVNGVRYQLYSSLGSTVLYYNPSPRSFGGQTSAYNRSVNGMFYSYRVTKGVARYTENFEVDLTNPYFPKKSGRDPYWDKMVVYLNAANQPSANPSTDIIGNAITYYGGATIDSVAGYPAFYFDGSNDYLSIPAPSGGWGLNNEYTVDWYAYSDSNTKIGSMNIGNYDTDAGGWPVGMLFSFRDWTGVRFYCYCSGMTEQYYDWTRTITANTLYHYAFVRNGSEAKFYINGVLTWTKTNLTLNGESTQEFTLGKWNYVQVPEYYKIRIPCLRITKVVRWYSDFEVPEFPFKLG